MGGSDPDIKGPSLSQHLTSFSDDPSCGAPGVLGLGDDVGHSGRREAGFPSVKWGGRGWGGWVSEALGASLGTKNILSSDLEREHR